MKKIILSAILGFALVISCEKKQEEKVTEEATKTEQTVSEESVKQDDHAKSDDHDEAAKLELNKGAKWIVNEEMKPSVAEGEKQLNAYQPENGDYKKLAADLSASTDKLVKTCTMTGVPHDNLHAWLAPHMKEIKKLQEADNREDANKIVGELKESMKKYHEYFN